MSDYESLLWLTNGDNARELLGRVAYRASRIGILVDNTEALELVPCLVAATDFEQRSLATRPDNLLCVQLDIPTKAISIVTGSL